MLADESLSSEAALTQRTNNVPNILNYRCYQCQAVISGMAVKSHNKKKKKKHFEKLLANNTVWQSPVSSHY